MVLKKFARGRVERGGAGNASVDKKVSMRKRGGMNEAYETVLVNDLKQKIDTNKDSILEQDDDYVLALSRHEVVGQREKCNAIGLVDDSDVEGIDPNYELVLRHSKKGDNVAGGEEQNFYPKHRRRSRCVAENLCERNKEVAGCATMVNGDHECFNGAQISGKNKVQNRFQKANEQLYHQLDAGSGMGNDGVKYGGEAANGHNKIHDARKITRVVSQLNLVRKDKQTDRINVDKKEKSCLYDLRSKGVKEWLLEHANKAQLGEMEKVQGQRCLQKLNGGKKAVGEGGAGKRKAVVQIVSDHFHHKRNIQENMLLAENGCKHAAQAQSGEMEKVQGQRYLQQLNRGKNAVGEVGAGKRKAVVQIVDDHFHHKRNIQENVLPTEHGCKAQPVKKYKEQIGGKLKGMVKKENKKLYQDSSPRTNRVTRSNSQLSGQVQLGKKQKARGHTELRRVVGCGGGISSKKTAFVTVNMETDHFVEADLHIKGSHSPIRCVNCAKSIPSEMEILDSDDFIKKRILSPFVPSQKHYSMSDKVPEHHVFRKEVLKALRKPYDKEEHRNYKEIMQTGSYIKHYPDLHRILAKFQYQRAKRLVIMRGFLFWLQNLTREGAFCPWEDEECLAVEISPC